MLIGMGLMKLGFFTGELPYASYWLTALIGFGISVPIYAVGILKAYSSGFYFLEMEKVGMAALLPHSRGRFAGHSRRRHPYHQERPLQGPSAQDRSRRQNRLQQLHPHQPHLPDRFIWGPWKLYGKLEYYQLMYVVFGVRAINLIVSPLWLKRYAFGPLEWLWRSLTYGVMQPMRLKTEL